MCRFRPSPMTRGDPGVVPDSGEVTGTPEVLWRRLSDTHLFYVVCVPCV